MTGYDNRKSVFKRYEESTCVMLWDIIASTFLSMAKLASNSEYSPSCFQTGDPHALASVVLWLQACTMPGSETLFFINCPV